MTTDATLNIDAVFVKEVLGKKSNYVDYLTYFFEAKNIEKSIPADTSSMIETIVTTWDYTVSKQIIRTMFFQTEKYKLSKIANQKLMQAKNEWDSLNLGELKWPFSAMGFDEYVHKINKNNELSETEKDKIVTTDAIRFRRIKEINTLRNDYIEYLIVTNNENIIPTLSHRRGTDFYINGKPFDQKVSKSVTKEFINRYGNNWFDLAIANPELVGKCLYEQQDEVRFGYEPRLFIVYLSYDVLQEKIEKIIGQTNFDKPLSINFSYTINGATTEYKTECYVVLLYN